jgi:hypothetical protein
MSKLIKKQKNEYASISNKKGAIIAQFISDGAKISLSAPVNHVTVCVESAGVNEDISSFPILDFGVTVSLNFSDIEPANITVEMTNGPYCGKLTPPLSSQTFTVFAILRVERWEILEPLSYSNGQLVVLYISGICYLVTVIYCTALFIVLGVRKAGYLKFL